MSDKEGDAAKVGHLEGCMILCDGPICCVPGCPLADANDAVRRAAIGREIKAAHPDWPYFGRDAGCVE